MESGLNKVKWLVSVSIQVWGDKTTFVPISPMFNHTDTLKFGLCHIYGGIGVTAREERRERGSRLDMEILHLPEPMKGV